MRKEHSISFRLGRRCRVSATRRVWSSLMNYTESTGLGNLEPGCTVGFFQKSSSFLSSSILLLFLSNISVVLSMNSKSTTDPTTRIPKICVSISCILHRTRRREMSQSRRIAGVASSSIANRYQQMTDAIRDLVTNRPQ